MAPGEILRHLESVADRIGVEIRFDAFDSAAAWRRGGLCRLRGRDVIVVDATLGVLDKLEIVALALSTFDTEHLYIPPEVRRKLAPRPERRLAGPSLRKARARRGGASG